MGRDERLPCIGTVALRDEVTIALKLATLRLAS
jgi:hypothetical protein